MAISKKMIEFTIRSSWIRKMFEEGAKLKEKYGADNVFDFSLGNPDLPPPPQFGQALQQIAAQTGPGAHCYMPNGGYPQVKTEIAKQLSSEQGVVLEQNDLLMTCGAAGALNVVLKSLLDPGDEVILLAPYFVEYNFYVDNHGGVSKIVNTDEEFNLDLAAIRKAISPKTKAIIVNSPNNPTGQIYSEESLAELGKLLEDCSDDEQIIYLLSDEPYRKIIYDDHHVPSIFTAYTNSIVVSSYSKDLSLPGERIGYIAVHPQIAQKAQLVGTLTLANRILGFVNAPALMQKVVGQLQGVTVDCDIYVRRRELFCSILERCGYEFTPPKGAFYIFPKSPIEDDAKFVSILQEHKILAVPGRGFGMPGYFRLAFCVDDKVIIAAETALKAAIEQV
jgi:aspartate aminotransferase